MEELDSRFRGNDGVCVWFWYRWAGVTDIPRWKSGLLMAFAGIVLAVIGELLGG